MWFSFFIKYMSAILQSKMMAVLILISWRKPNFFADYNEKTNAKNTKVYINFICISSVKFKKCLVFT